MQNNTMAIVSLVFGILGLIGICPGLGSIIAVVTGGMAKNEIKNSGGAQGGEQLAQWGTILGWVGVGLVVLGICVALIAFVFAIVMGGVASQNSWLPALLF